MRKLHKPLQSACQGSAGGQCDICLHGGRLQEAAQPHVVALVGLPLCGSCCSLCPGNTTVLSSWRPTREIPPGTWHQEKLCFYWALSFGAGLVYLLDTEVTLTDHIFSLLLERPGRNSHPFALRTLDIVTHILRLNPLTFLTVSLTSSCFLGDLYSFNSDWNTFYYLVLYIVYKLLQILLEIK